MHDFSVSTQLREARQKNGLSQSELARRARVSLATIQNIEANRANPEWETLTSLFSALNLRIEIHSTALDWNHLAQLGCPIMVDNSSSMTLPRVDILLSSLETICPYYDAINPETREHHAVTAWFCALRDHYPSIWSHTPQILQKKISKNIAVPIKLRRLALQRLASYL